MKKGLLQRLKNSNGGVPLDDTFYRFLAVHISFLIFTTLPSTFINTFLMSQSRDMTVVLYYNALNYLFTAFGMFISSIILHHLNAGIVSMVGIILFNLLYLQLIIFNVNAADYVIPLGITNGLAGSFYWMSYNQRLTDSTTLYNRDGALATISIFGNIMNLTIPLISGLIISSVGGINGYIVIFGLAFVVAIVTGIISIHLPNPECPKTPVKYGAAFRCIINNKCLVFGMMGDGFRGIREGVFAFILNILLYQFIKSEALVGFNTLLSGAAAIASFVIISRIMKVGNRVKYMRLAAICLFVFSLGVVFTIGPTILIVFTVINSFFSGFLVNPSVVTCYDAIQVAKGAAEIRPEIFAFKELILATGRCIGLGFILFVNYISKANVMWLAVALVILSVTQILTIYACAKTIKLMSEQEEPIVDQKTLV